MERRKKNEMENLMEINEIVKDKKSDELTEIVKEKKWAKLTKS